MGFGLGPGVLSGLIVALGLIVTPGPVEAVPAVAAIVVASGVGWGFGLASRPDGRLHRVRARWFPAKWLRSRS